MGSDAVPGGAVAVTAPVTYATEPLARPLEGTKSTSLVLPNLLMYVPCARQPRLRDGVAEVPRHVVAVGDTLTPALGTGVGPFDGVLDLYTLDRIPLTDSKDPSGGVAVYTVGRRIPGSAQAAPEASTTAIP